MTSPDYSQRVPAADRALSLLENLAAAPRGLTTADLLADMGGSRSGLYALVNTLRSRGYVTTEEGRHRIGPALEGLVPRRPPMLNDLLDAFAAETRTADDEETVALCWPDPQGVVVVAQAAAASPVRVVYDTGARRGRDSADGAVIAAASPDDHPDLADVRRNGSAIRRNREVVEVAVPICADGVRPVAALLCGLPEHRASQQAVTSATASLRRLGARLSHHLGAPVYQPYGWVSAEGIGPTRELDPDEVDEFLGGVFGAQLACVRPDGTPHVVPLWYEWDGEALWIPASPEASWKSYVVDNPRVSVTIDEPWPPLRRLLLAGEARETPARAIPGGLSGLRRRLAVRYLGQGAETRPELTDTSGWSAIRIRPERISGRQGLGPEHLRRVS